MKKQTSVSQKAELTLRDVAYSALQIGFGVAIIAAGCAFGGVWLDRTFETGNLLTFLAIGAGLFLSGVFVWQIIKPLYERGNR